jgi:predicted TIM-barrel fold metal-dependent hydrolase
MTIKRFVDAHIHLWKLDLLRYPWLSPPFSDSGPNGSVEPIAQDYLPVDYFADAKGYNVTKTVHIDAGAHPDDAIPETRWLQGLADRGTPGNTGPNAIVAFAALNAPDVEKVLAAHVESKNVRGIRHIINWHPDPNRTYTPRDLLLDDDFAKGYALLGRYKLSFDLQIYPNQMTDAYKLAKNHPNIPVIINHMGMPVDRDAAGVARWKSGIELLASLPHVSCKISGLGFVDRNWTADSMRGMVLETIERFGTRRAMFASDFPTDKLFNSYSKGLEAYDTITRDFSESDRDALFAGNAERIYRI